MSTPESSGQQSQQQQQQQQQGCDRQQAVRTDLPCSSCCTEETTPTEQSSCLPPPISSSSSSCLGGTRSVDDGSAVVVVDSSDNAAQTQFLLEHYRKERCRHHTENNDDNDEALESFLQDYTATAVVHQVADNTCATTHYGKEGGQQIWNRFSPPSQYGTLHVVRMSIQNNYARVIWNVRCRIPEDTDIRCTPTSNAATTTKTTTTLYGTDWFLLDATNHIQSQTTVALSQES